MAAAWTGAAARQATRMARLSSPELGFAARPASNIQRRGLATGVDAKEPGKQLVSFWEDPLHPSRWKEEHYALVNVVVWGSVFYGGYRYLARDQSGRQEENVGGA